MQGTSIEALWEADLQRPELKAEGQDSVREEDIKVWSMP